MSGLRFWKTQSVGNDFILLHADDVAAAGLEDRLDAVAMAMGERQFGIGSDGLLVISAHNAVPKLMVLRRERVNSQTSNPNSIAIGMVSGTNSDRIKFIALPRVTT